MFCGPLFSVGDFFILFFPEQIKTEQNRNIFETNFYKECIIIVIIIMVEGRRAC